MVTHGKERSEGDAEKSTATGDSHDLAGAIITRWRRAIVPSWADKNFHILLAARLAMSASRAVAGVITALYLSSEGFSGVEIGVLFVVVTIASATMSITIGLISDRVGRRPFLVAVPLLTAAAAVVFGTVRIPAMLFIFAALGSLGRGAGAGGAGVGPYQPAESAFVAEGVPGKHRADAFGRLAFSSSLGALLGGLLAGLAHGRPGMGAVEAASAYHPAFLAAALLALTAGLLALGLNEALRPKESGKSNFHWPRRSWPVLWRFWITNGVNGFAIGLSGPFISYWFNRRFGAGPGKIGLLFAIIAFGSLVSSLSAAGIARRMGTVNTITIVRAISALLLVPIALAPSFLVAGALYFVRMLSQRLGMPLRQSFTQDMADPAERSSLAALSNLPLQATMGGSQALAGYLFDEVSLAAPFELAAVFQCANTAFFWILFHWKPPKQAASLFGTEVEIAAEAEATDDPGVF
ncbi:MAG: MFS transporter [Actinomycetota bacterium]|nr:MAG: MFS transporter [Actinomycetota bacterium]